MLSIKICQFLEIKFKGQFLKIAVLSFGLAQLIACSVLKEKENSNNDIELNKLVTKPLPPEKTEELLEEVGSNWLYGQGMGETALTAGTILAFPPYAIYVLGNGILSLSGYEELRVSDALPEAAREEWNSAYDTVTSGPGRISAAVAGEEFRNREIAKDKITEIFKDG